MSLSEFPQDSVIFNAGDPLLSLSLITEGSAEVRFIDGRQLYFEEGDIIGLFGLGTGKHCCTYTAVSDATLSLFPCEDLEALETLLCDDEDTAILIVDSMCRQISELLRYRLRLKQSAGDMYDLILTVYQQYEQLCSSNALTPQKLKGLQELEPFSGHDPVEVWVHNYYTEMNDLDPDVRGKFYYQNPGISFGFLRKGAEDILQVYRACVDYMEYIKKVSALLLNKSGHDLIALVSDLHYKSLNIEGADADVEALMTELAESLSEMTGADSDYFQERMDTYAEKLFEKQTMQETSDGSAVSDSTQDLSDSLDIILSYSGCPEEKCDQFTRCVREYTKLSDRGGIDDGARRLRSELTGLFFEIYVSVFIKQLSAPSDSTIIKMFLNFGYVDAALAGQDNANYLYSIANSVGGDSSVGVYTFCEWLTAIYNGSKEPSRNEFGMDYGEHIHEMRKKGEIDEKREALLMKDSEARLRFELESVFPVLNKVTCGRMSSYCPLFADHYVQRGLEVSQVTPEKLRMAIDEIRSVDPSAYYREILYSNPKYDLSNEYIHTEVLPDIILMPNAGTRGSLWQEIEGKKRTTPARMFLPLFLEPGLKNVMLRLTADFRWEMCKRTQGIRWNDITNPSLTSVYSDYLQFYRNNRDLTIEAKNDLKQQLSIARNNFKTVFISDYLDWVLYESNGSQRMTKVVRNMMMTYCPFSSAIRGKLALFPQYADILNRYNTKQQQRTKRMENIIQMVGRKSKVIPQELLDELEYTKI